MIELCQMSLYRKNGFTRDLSRKLKALFLIIVFGNYNVLDGLLNLEVLEEYPWASNYNVSCQATLKGNYSSPRQPQFPLQGITRFLSLYRLFDPIL